MTRPTHDHPRPFCGQGCPAFGDVFARYPSIAKPTPKAKAPSRLRSKPNPIPPSVREAVLEAAGRTCEWCGVPGGRLIIHHKLLRSQGGRHRREDCAALHQSCHEQVHANPSEARRRGLIVGVGSNQ